MNKAESKFNFIWIKNLNSTFQSKGSRTGSSKSLLIASSKFGFQIVKIHDPFDFNRQERNKKRYLIVFLIDSRS